MIKQQCGSVEVCKQWSNSRSNLPASGIIDGCELRVHWNITLEWSHIEVRGRVCFTFVDHMRTLKSDQSPNVSIRTPGYQKSNYGRARKLSCLEDFVQIFPMISSSLMGGCDQDYFARSFSTDCDHIKGVLLTLCSRLMYCKVSTSYPDHIWGVFPPVHWRSVLCSDHIWVVLITPTCIVQFL